MTYRVCVAGTRGVPATHGGFETFAEELSLFLSRNGVDVTVYCQVESRRSVFKDQWRGVRRVGLHGLVRGALGTVVFDLRCILGVLRHRPDVVLTLGYNTAVFCLLLRVFQVPNVINMDGIEWHRAKWGRYAKAWFRLNEWAGAMLGDWLIADHPEIKRHLSRHGVSRKTSVIPYGAHQIGDVNISIELGVGDRPFLCVIARPEPENSILEIVKAFSLRKRQARLLVLGRLEDSNPYHKAIRNAASEEVVFCGAIYEASVVASIRSACVAYIHGHTVGGTNPSLVEALGAGAAVIAHDNRYNRWVARDAAIYFSDISGLDECVTRVLECRETLAALRECSRNNHASRFQWQAVLAAYDSVLRACGRGAPNESATAGMQWES